MSYRDREDPTLFDALERVVGAGQTLIIRRIDLLAEELAAHVWSQLVAAASVVLGATTALAGWFIVLAGVINLLDDYFARFAVEVAIGALHVGAGLALVLLGRSRVEPPKVTP